MTATSGVRSHDSEREWRVQVFRHTSKGLVKMEATNKDGHILPVHVRVAQGSITIPQVKLRLDFTGGNSSKQGDKTISTKPTLLFVRRRRDTIVIGGEGRIRKVLLRFRNNTECQEFSDLLVRLNPPRVLGEAAPDPKTLADESGEALTYVARLLNEPDFLSYVDDLESYLLSSDDGQQMLDSLC